MNLGSSLDLGYFLYLGIRLMFVIFELAECIVLETIIFKLWSLCYFLLHNKV